VLDHLPSVPSVVLPIQSPTQKVGLSCFLLAFHWIFVSIQFARISFILRNPGLFRLTVVDLANLSNDKIRQFQDDKFCAERSSTIGPRQKVGQDDKGGRNTSASECAAKPIGTLLPVGFLPVTVVLYLSAKLAA
jgi:hypothetical protein